MHDAVSLTCHYSGKWFAQLHMYLQKVKYDQTLHISTVRVWTANLVCKITLSTHRQFSGHRLLSRSNFPRVYKLHIKICAWIQYKRYGSHKCHHIAIITAYNSDFQYSLAADAFYLSLCNFACFVTCPIQQCYYFFVLRSTPPINAFLLCSQNKRKELRNSCTVTLICFENLDIIYIENKHF